MFNETNDLEKIIKNNTIKPQINELIIGINNILKVNHNLDDLYNFIKSLKKWIFNLKYRVLKNFFNVYT